MTEIVVGGTRFNNAISSRKITEIQEAKSKTDVESLWDKIVDWFCGTKREEAKKVLFDLFHEENKINKMKSFNQLKNLVSPAYKREFKHEMTEVDDHSFEIALSIPCVLEKYKITSEEAIFYYIDSAICSGEPNLTQLKKDVGRMPYTLNSHRYDYSEEAKNQTKALLALKEITANMPDPQKKSLDAIASQTGIIHIKNGIFELGNGEMAFFALEPEISISTEANGLVKVELDLTQNCETEKFKVFKESVPTALYPRLSMKVNINIYPEGNYDISEVKVTAQKEID